MPRYDFRCRSCGATFEMRRPISQANAPAMCPQGHYDAVKLMSPVAVSIGVGAPAAPAPSGGGCCGGSCGCGQ